MSKEMKYFKIEVERTYTTEVYVKCKDEKTVQDVLDATFSDRMLFDAQTNLRDHIVEEEMEQCVVILDSITPHAVARCSHICIA